MSVSRRKFLQGSGIAGLSAATLASFPASIQKALAIPANNKTGTIKDVEHVVILMQENRAFDHYFGTLKGVRGFGDRFTIPQPNGRSVWQQIAKDGSMIMPYHLDQEMGNAQRFHGTPHEWDDSQKAWDNGRMTSWATHKTNYSMGYFEEKEIPFQFALAKAFTICDAYHCSMHTGTDANRSFFLTGTNGAIPTGTSFVNNEWDWIDGDPKTVDVGYTWTTYAERLEAAGISWISYQNMPDEWGDNMLGAFRKFRKANIASGFPVSSGGEPNKPYNNTGQAVPYHAYNPTTDNANNPLYKGIANTLPGTTPERYLDAFKKDVLDGKLPQVSWINAPSIYCEHPGPSSPVQGAWFIQEILDALTANPEVWSKTVLLVNFDENDGYFDHVPSPSAPSPDGKGGFAGKTTLSVADLQAEYFTHAKPDGSKSQSPADGRVYGPGPRVPMFVISPWSRGGWVNSQNFDHTSVLQFLEARFGVKETNISPYRRAMLGDLTSAFNFKEPNNEVLPTLSGKKSRQEADALRANQEKLPYINVPAMQVLPKQATGYQPSRALPYRLHTTAHVDSQNVGLVFANTGTAGCVFHVYNKLDLNRIPRRYAVEAGKQLNDTWSVNIDGLYDLWVLSNNGYHRHFVGNTLSKNKAEIRVCYDIANGNVYVDIMNQSATALTFSITPKAYFDSTKAMQVMIAAGKEQQVHWDLTDSGRWYDFEVTIKEDANWLRRFAGRVETGEHGITDPAMGL